jgi:hypothetical protein
MATAEEIWIRVFPALEALTMDFVNEPVRSWAERRKVFLDPLGGDHAGQDLDIAALIEWLDELSESDRSILLSGSLSAQAKLRIDQRASKSPRDAGDPAEPGGEAADTDQGDSPEQYNLDAWYAFVAENGTAWNGTAETWTAFVDWFAYVAAENRLSHPAQGLLGELAPLSLAGRVGLLAEYGVAAPGTAQLPVAELPVAELPVAERLEPEPLEPEPATEPWGWVAPAQQQVLEAAWGSRWQAALETDLDARWGPGWPENPPEHKAAWLSDLISGGDLPGAAPGLSAPEQDAPDQDAPEGDAPEAAVGSQSESATREAILSEISDVAQKVPGFDELTDQEIAEVVAELLLETRS